MPFRIFQKASPLHERLALSLDKTDIRKLAKEGQVIVRPEDLLKEPRVLEFLGLDGQMVMSERRLELPYENGGRLRQIDTDG